MMQISGELGGQQAKTWKVRFPAFQGLISEIRGRNLEAAQFHEIAGNFKPAAKFYEKAGDEKQDGSLYVKAADLLRLDSGDRKTVECMVRLYRKAIDIAAGAGKDAERQADYAKGKPMFKAYVSKNLAAASEQYKFISGCYGEILMVAGEGMDILAKGETRKLEIFYSLRSAELSRLAKESDNNNRNGNGK